MSPYLAIFGARYRVLLQYRAAALAGFVTQLFWGLMRSMVIAAFYTSSSGPHPMTLREAIDYVWLGQALLLVLPWNLDSDVEQLVRSGDVVYELVRPLDLYWLWWWRAAAWRTAPALLRALPMFVVAGLCFGLSPPPSLAAALAFLGAALGAVALSAGITTLMSVSLFWTLSGEGLVRLLPSVVMVLSGMLVPLPFFPAWAQPLIAFLPFRGVMDIPFRIYMGHIPAAQAPLLIAQQLAWAAVLALLGRALLGRGLRRLVVQGG